MADAEGDERWRREVDGRRARRAEYERDTGDKLDLNFGTAGSLRDRIKGGEAREIS